MQAALALKGNMQTKPEVQLELEMSELGAPHAPLHFPSTQIRKGSASPEVPQRVGVGVRGVLGLPRLGQRALSPGSGCPGMISDVWLGPPHPLHK